MKRPQTVLSGALKQEFQKDLELFKYFLLLLNDAGPIRNVELMWNEELDPRKPKYKNRIGTGDALVQLQPAGSSSKRNSPSTRFCDLVHGFGAHEEETCAKSDVPAQKRCRATGCSQVYPCHVGLTDVAVPVICDGQYLGTLFTGQVLTQPPTAEGFAVVRGALAGQPHIDFRALEAAYFRVPVVSQAQVAEMVRMLELFARYISNSWKRLQIIAEAQRNHDRELSLDRKELAALLLSGEVGDREELDELIARAGLHRVPDRVLVLQVEVDTAANDGRTHIVEHLTLNRLSHAVEDVCQQWPDTLATVLRPGELCIFTSLEVRNRSHERISLRELAESILAAARAQHAVTARIGISNLHCQPEELLRAYQEASASLESGSDAVSFFQDVATPGNDHPVDRLGRLLRAILRGEGAASSIREFLAQALPSTRSTTRVQQLRAVLTWAIEHLTLEIVTAGGDRQRLTTAKEQAISGVLHAPTPLIAGEAFTRFVDLVAEQVAATYSQREHKIVRAISDLVEEYGPANVTIQHLATALHLSSGHLSRVFRRTTGMTLENFLVQQRVQLAKRILLDPRLNVAEVADRCGFCSPAYFASVFRKYMHCTPREYASDPHRHTEAAPRGLPPVREGKSELASIVQPPRWVTSQIRTRYEN
ncbi:MAG: PocR ligand-binding domain-containing protein [Terriglobales bacterium]